LFNHGNIDQALAFAPHNIVGHGNFGINKQATEGAVKNFVLAMLLVEIFFKRLP
jgi:hypothetical protein